ncbi:hypothetical protein JHK87_033614 [Glycine soja]|nr:hypothetical protein JHK87_033614 [Glycine soja]
MGCDASVLLDDTSTFTGEKSACANVNSLRGFEVIDDIKTKVEAACPGVVSFADILAIVALGRSILECWVRQKRFNQASKNSATTDIPSPLKDLSVHISSFSNKGFNTKEMVALSVKLSKHYGDINLSPLGVTTSVLFDTAYFKNLINKKGLLHSDQQLFSGGSTDSRVTAYSNDPSAFYADFASAMVKMGNLSSLTRKSGQIRSNCHKVN